MKLRLAYSRINPPQETRRLRKKSKPSSITLPASALLSWKVERLQELRPAAVDVIERLVDDMLDEIARGGRR